MSGAIESAGASFRSYNSTQRVLSRNDAEASEIPPEQAESWPLKADS
jgi:hypothetical protein